MKNKTKRTMLTIMLAICMTLSLELQAFADAPGTIDQTLQAEAAGFEAEQPQTEQEEIPEEAEGQNIEDIEWTSSGEMEIIGENAEEEPTEQEPSEENAEEEPTEQEPSEEKAEEEPSEQEPSEEKAEEEPSVQEPSEEKAEEEPSEQEIPAEETTKEPQEQEDISEEVTAEESKEQSREAVADGDDDTEDAKTSGDEGQGSVSAQTTMEHYLAFASDLHGMPDVLENAMEGFPQNTEYVSIIGDLVGARGGDAPEYDAGDVYERVHEIFDNLKTDQLSIIWADHDANVTNRNNIVKCEGGNESGQIYEGKNADGSTAYYIYGIGFYHMTKGGEISQAAAKEFKEWVRDKDVTIPILVLCHVPLQARRGDNHGAPYWNEAFNYAATGIEGITTDNDEGEIIRNVIFLCGHNHTVDETEYVYLAGTKMLVQIDSSDDSQSSSDASSESEGGHSGHSHHKEKAKGVTSNIFYTEIVPGYLKTSGNASLLSITEKLISITKYNGGQEVSLGVNGFSNAIMDATLEILQIRWGDPEYVWSDDLSRVEASRSLVNTSALTQKEIAETVSEITKEATCEEEGLITYTAVFKNTAFEKLVKTKTIPALGHDWGEWTVTKEATATKDGEMTRVCRNDASHIETKIIPATGEETEEDTDPGENTDDKTDGNKDENTDENPDGNSGGNTDEKPDGNSGDNTDQDNRGGNGGDKSRSSEVTETNITGNADSGSTYNKSAMTGDEAQAALWIIMALAAGIGILCVKKQSDSDIRAN